MTTAQLQSLKADIALDPVLSAMPHNSDSGFEVARVYNLNAAPEFVVWRTSVSLDEIMLNGFDWTRVYNLSVGKSRIWEWMFKVTGNIDPSKPNIRAGIESVWVGTQADLNVRAAVYVHCKRPASRVEKLLATGTGTTDSPATMGVESPISYYDVMQAWAS